MLRITSENFRAYLILEMTKEIIRHTKAYQKEIAKKQREKIFQQEIQVKNIPQEVYERSKIGNFPIPQQEIYQKNEPINIPPPKLAIPIMVHEKIQEQKERISQLKKAEKQKESEFKQELAKRIIPSPARHLKKLKIPELQLPETVSYIRPIPTFQNIDLDKLNPLIRDPMIKTIECNGSEEKIIVTGLMGRKNTSIILTTEDIDEIIARFADAARIPVGEGIFKVVFGRLVLSAIVSSVVDSKFIIRKMSDMPVPNYMPYWKK